MQEKEAFAELKALMNNFFNDQKCCGRVCVSILLTSQKLREARLSKLLDDWPMMALISIITSSARLSQSSKIQLETDDIRLYLSVPALLADGLQLITYKEGS